MIDWLLAALFFLAVFNPAAIALLLARADGRPSSRDDVMRLLPAVVAAVVILALLALVSENVLDTLDLSLSTFQIAAGVVIIIGALQASLALGLSPEDLSTGWANVRLLIWMISPASLMLALAFGADEGFGVAVASLVAGAVIALALAAAWVGWRGLANRFLLDWLRRMIAAGAVVAAIDLVRQGVENV
ncbi:MAG TPA: MarC family protein [Thermomicrobiales bacterium]|nr:MarC family protein [Thermomicrobiales bacterium]